MRCHVVHAAIAYFTGIFVKNLMECVALGKMFAYEMKKLSFDVAMCVFAKRRIEPNNFPSSVSSFGGPLVICTGEL